MKYEEALKYSMNLCSKSERCKSEVRAKLQGYKLNENDIERVLSDLVKEKFIDESRFAVMFSNDKLRLNKWGKIKIRYMLMQKSIPGEIIDDALNKIDSNEYEDVLTHEIIKKRSTIRSGSIWDVRSKLSRFASQRGFESDIIRKILDLELK
jgi:regulatory protein